jgi:hypothetical protein
MNPEYRIEPSGRQFTVIDPWGDHLVELFPTEDAAKQEIERCKKNDEVWEAAKLLVDTAIKAHMEMFGVDRETARYWISSAGHPTS